MQLERLSDNVVKGLASAEQEAVEIGSAVIEAVHFIPAMLSAKADSACKLLSRFALNQKDARHTATKMTTSITGHKINQNEKPPLSLEWNQYSREQLRSQTHSI